MSVHYYPRLSAVPYTVVGDIQPRKGLTRPVNPATERPAPTPFEPAADLGWVEVNIELTSVEQAERSLLLGVTDPLAHETLSGCVETWFFGCLDVPELQGPALDR